MRTAQMNSKSTFLWPLSGNGRLWMHLACTFVDIDIDVHVAQLNSLCPGTEAKSLEK